MDFVDEQSKPCLLDFQKHNSEISSSSLELNQKLLCIHCGRTKDNLIRCIGKCVEDNDY